MKMHYHDYKVNRLIENVRLIQKRNKLRTYRFLICLLIGYLMMPMVSYGQVKTDTTEERMDEASFKTIKDGYNYIIRAEEEEISMFKVDLLSTGIYVLNAAADDSDTIPISFFRMYFERKWKPNLSWIVGLDFKGIDKSLEEIHLSGGIRYYYNMNKRILKGKSANNFSADYLGIALRNQYHPPNEDYGFSFNLSYGFQRRLGKYGYFDFEIGLENIIEPASRTSGGIELFSTIQLGVAF